MSSDSQAIRLRIRVVGIAGDAFGPGKAQLLEEIAQTNSLREAASRLKMSYMKAWRLTKAMNENFSLPLVLQVRGGKSGGGTQLTDAGKKVLETYHKMSKKALQAAKKDGDALTKLLKS